MPDQEKCSVVDPDPSIYFKDNLIRGHSMRAEYWKRTATKWFFRAQSLMKQQACGPPPYREHPRAFRCCAAGRMIGF